MLRSIGEIMEFVRLENPDVMIINNIQLWPPRTFGFMIDKRDYIQRGLIELKKRNDTGL